MSEVSPQSVVESFLTDIASIRSTSVLFGTLTLGMQKVTRDQLRNFLEPYIQQNPEMKNLAVAAQEGRRFQRLKQEFDRADRGGHLVSRSFIVSLVSQYDAFLSALVSALYEMQPALMKNSKKTIEFCEVLTYGSIEELKTSVVDEEIEDLLRESHAKQFVWLENKFAINTLRKDLDIWPSFIEITERRNLFVHADGKVSKQYLKTCQEQGVPLPAGTAVGTQLIADMSYVRHSTDVFFEMAVKLTQVLWRKTKSSDIERADEGLNAICYRLLEKRRYKLAIKLLDFAFETVKRHSSNEWRLRLLVNRANAYRLIGDTKKSLELISSEDWSAYSPTFRLAASVLRGDISEAVQHMQAIGPTGTPDKDDYRNWPLFEGLRSNEEFAKAFEQIFGEELTVPELVSAEIDTINARSDGDKYYLEYFDMADVEELESETKGE